MKRDTWRIPPPLHEKFLLARLTLFEWSIVAVAALVVFFAFIQTKGIQGIPYLSIPIVLYIFFRRNDTDYGCINGVEIAGRYIRYFWQYTIGTDTFVLERIVRDAEEKEE